MLQSEAFKKCYTLYLIYTYKKFVDTWPSKISSPSSLIISERDNVWLTLMQLIAVDGPWAVTVKLLEYCSPLLQKYPESWEAQYINAASFGLVEHIYKRYSLIMLFNIFQYLEHVIAWLNKSTFTINMLNLTRLKKRKQDWRYGKVTDWSSSGRFHR